MDNTTLVKEGKVKLGLEFGSTRIKAVLIKEGGDIISTGSYDWENRKENGIWTYTKDDILTGLKSCYSSLNKNTKEKTGVTLTKVEALGISAMMHGYIALDENDEFLTPFRTWRNTITEKESEELTKLFNYPIPQRWTISHLYKDVKEKKEYLKSVKHVFTLASYVHYLLTGEANIGIGDASGMFPIDTVEKEYIKEDLETFDNLYLKGIYSWTLSDVFPKVLVAGKSAGSLTEKGRDFLDETKTLEIGALFAPPEGDAETGMMATNSVKENTGNISAGTSAFAMIVLDKALERAHDGIDLVTTPNGYQVAMSHSNNCTSQYDAAIKLFSQVLDKMGFQYEKSQLYDVVLNSALKADKDAPGYLSIPYVSGEHITGVSDGRPLSLRNPAYPVSLSSFILSELYSSLATTRIGLDKLKEEEGVSASLITGHGGFFKSVIPALHVASSVLATKVRVLEGAGEGGAWGMALLADYLSFFPLSLSDYLDSVVFKSVNEEEYLATKEEMEGFNLYLERFKKALSIEKEAGSVF